MTYDGFFNMLQSATILLAIIAFALSFVYLFTQEADSEG